MDFLDQVLFTVEGLAIVRGVSSKDIRKKVVEKTKGYIIVDETKAEALKEFWQVGGSLAAIARKHEVNYEHLKGKIRLLKRKSNLEKSPIAIISLLADTETTNVVVSTARTTSNSSVDNTQNKESACAAVENRVNCKDNEQVHQDNNTILHKRLPGPESSVNIVCPMSGKYKKNKICKSTHKQNNSEPVCLFCSQPAGREIELGKFHQMSKVSAHYYCLLFSCALEQNGEDDEGILGFLQNDIIKEVNRGSKLKCVYCGLFGATVGCNNKCRSAYHFPCGLDNNALYKFAGDFSSFCVKHREFQTGENLSKQVECAICLEQMVADPKHAIYPPCCKKSSWFHKICLQKLALSAGYFFKCPLCNDTDTFVKEMLSLGVYVPEQDASWEQEPNAFQELLERPTRCDATKCLCRKGRLFDDDDGKWEVLLCESCGSTGVHSPCAGLPPSTKVWDCESCVNILRKLKNTSAETAPATPGDLGSPGPSNESPKFKALTINANICPTQRFADLTQSSVDVVLIKNLARNLKQKFKPYLISKLNSRLSLESASDCSPPRITKNLINQFCSLELNYRQMCALYDLFNCFLELNTQPHKGNKRLSTGKVKPSAEDMQHFFTTFFTTAVSNARQAFDHDLWEQDVSSNTDSEDRYDVVTVNSKNSLDRSMPVESVDQLKTRYSSVLKECFVPLDKKSAKAKPVKANLEVCEASSDSDDSMPLAQLFIHKENQSPSIKPAAKPKPANKRLKSPKDTHKYIQQSISKFFLKAKPTEP